MNKNFPDFGGFPTDNSSSTNLKYDIIASKFMTGIENHKRSKSNRYHLSEGFVLIATIAEGLTAIVILIFVGINWIWRRYK